MQSYKITIIIIISYNHNWGGEKILTVPTSDEKKPTESSMWEATECSNQHQNPDRGEPQLKNTMNA